MSVNQAQSSELPTRPGPLRRLIQSIRNRLMGKEKLMAGDHHHRAYVGPPDRYDLMGHLQLKTMIGVGLLPDSYMLDIGCGSLRAGKRFIPYLEPEHYFGIEPNQWLLDEGIEKELGRATFEEKRPTFSNDTNFTLTEFGVKFDFMMAQSIFTHAAGHQIDRCLSQARACMKENGVMIANFMEGDSDYEGSEWVYPGCCKYTLGYFEAMANKHGLRCEVLTLPEPWPGDLTVIKLTPAPAP
jgi:hypothetical protein